MAQQLAVQSHAILALLVAGYVGGGIVTAQNLGVPERMTLARLSVVYPAIGVLVVLALFHVLNRRGARNSRPPHPNGASGDRRRLRELLPSPSQLLVAVPTALMMILLVQAFGSFKTMIPLIHPYQYWDVEFAAWDGLLHGGVQPWQLIQPVVGFPLVTWALNAVYYFLWFPLLLVMLLWQCFDMRRPIFRLQFLFTFVIAWILLGSLAATVFSSAGPCYYGAVTRLNDPFVPLLEYLDRANESYPLLALTVQDKLWQFYTGRMFVQGAAISAMPSLHVAMAFLFALVGWRVNRCLGMFLGLFTVLIQVGSVHLGWHYAIDGYASIISIWAIWKIVGYLLGRNAMQPRQSEGA
ncbi:MAG: phosphatase PAP2 family protein [Dongiaceae bacterium]